MTLPWNIRVAEEAMIAVPYLFREGSYALGATKWQTIRRIVLLSASPSVITGFVLGLGAALGETTVLILTSDLSSGSLPTGLSLTRSGMVTLPVQIFRTFRWNIGGGGRSYQWEQTNIAFAEGFTLLIIFLAISVLALVARNYLSKKTLGH
jgi:phosphate transport system permease protein